MRAFWSVRETRGGQIVPMTDSGLWMLKFFIPAQQTVPSSAKIWDVSEVAETHSLALGGFTSDRGQNEKKNLGWKS